VIAWHLLSDPDARFCELGPGYYAARIDPERRKQSHIRQLEALGSTVTLQPAAGAANRESGSADATPDAAARS